MKEEACPKGQEETTDWTTFSGVRQLLDSKKRSTLRDIDTQNTDTTFLEVSLPSRHTVPLDFVRQQDSRTR
jgi:hypothetical protein